MSNHTNLVNGEIHKIHNSESADRDTLLAIATTSTDVGKIFRVTDSDEYYICKSAGSPGTFLIAGNTEIAETITSDATVTVAYSYTMSDASSIVLTCKINAMETDGTDRDYWWITGLFYRSGGGSATQQGSTASVITAITSDATWLVEFDVSGNDVRVRVTGDAGTDINWITETELIHNI